MPVLAIVGAGPGMGLAIAETFGANGYKVGLLSRNWAHALHAAVAAEGVQGGHVAINAWIGRQPGARPDAIAPLYRELHTQRDEIEKVYTPTGGEAGR